nr:hypothetical protein [uncultured Capnocytophaga sp.]
MKAFLSILTILVVLTSCQKDNNPKVAPPSENLNTLIGYWQREHATSCAEEEILLITDTKIGWVPLQEKDCLLAYPKIIEYTYTLGEGGKLVVGEQSAPWEYNFQNKRLLLKKNPTGNFYPYKRISAEEYQRFISEHQKKP